MAPQAHGPWLARAGPEGQFGSASSLALHFLMATARTNHATRSCCHGPSYGSHQSPCQAGLCPLNCEPEGTFAPVSCFCQLLGHSKSPMQFNPPHLAHAAMSCDIKSFMHHEGKVQDKTSAFKIPGPERADCRLAVLGHGSGCRGAA